jgi:GNAT superfamily N-acetyltransferase
MSNSKPVTSILVLPKAHDDQGTWDRLVAKHQAFRLSSLKESPEAFASTFATEQTYTKEFWEARMRNTRATTMIAIATPDLPSMQEKSGLNTSLLEGEWLASTTMIRFEGDEIAELSSSNISPWKRVPEKGNNESNAKEGERHIVYVLNGVYVIPEARGFGFGTTLLKGALEVGNTLGRKEGATKVNFQARAVATNAGAVKLYEKAGFSVSLKETLVMKKHVALGSTQETEVYIMDR